MSESLPNTTVSPEPANARMASLGMRYGLAVLLVVLDQITKLAVEGSLALYEQVEITPFFNLTLAYNTGAAFSFLADAGGWQRWFFTVVSLLVSVVLAVWLYRMPPRERWLGVAVAMILGGAIGNLIDRVLYGHVIDFIQVHWRDVYYYPSFNVADSAITCGTVLLLVMTFFESRDRTDSDDA